MGDFFFLTARNREDQVKVKWDDKNTVHITLNGEHNGGVAGLCGNYDGNAEPESKCA